MWLRYGIRCGYVVDYKEKSQSYGILLRQHSLERFFHREQREAKVQDIINLRQGALSVKEYSLKLVKRSKYASSLVSSSRDEMSRFVTCVS